MSGFMQSNERLFHEQKRPVHVNQSRGGVKDAEYFTERSFSALPAFCRIVAIKLSLRAIIVHFFYIGSCHYVGNGCRKAAERVCRPKRAIE